MRAGLAVVGATAAAVLTGLAARADVPGTTVTYKPYIETEIGFDSNPDSLFRHFSSRFEKLEAGLAVVAKRPSEVYELSIKARGVQFDELAINNRWDFRTALDATFDLAPGQTLKVGTSYLRDFFALNRADVLKSFADYQFKADDYKLRLQAKSHVELNIERDEGGATAVASDVFDTIRGRAFDYSKTEGQVAFLGFTRSWLLPFLIYNFANLDYFHQAADPIVDRNAIEHFGIAGIRVDLGKPFRIDLGGRFNHRDFEDQTVQKFSSSYFDMNFLWTPIETFKVKGVIERVVKESSSSFGLADDVISYGLTVDWRVAKPVRFVLSGYYDHVTPVGDDFVYKKYTLTSTATYDWSDNIELFASGLAKMVNEQNTGDSYTRYKIGTGIRFKF